MMESRKVSVIIPYFNSDSTLGRCLDSLKRQTYRNLELVIVNDGSSEASVQRLQAMLNGFPSLTLLHQENQGCDRARIAGQKVAHGDYLMFQDADDWLAEDAIEKLVEALEQHDADWVTGKARYCKLNGKETAFLYEEQFERVKPAGHLWNLPLASENILPVIHGKLFRKSFLDAHGLAFPDTDASGDSYFCLQTYFHARKIVYLQDILYFRVRDDRSGSLSTTYDAGQIARRVRIMGLIRQFCDQHGLDFGPLSNLQHILMLYVRIPDVATRRVAHRAILEALDGTYDAYLERCWCTDSRRLRAMSFREFDWRLLARNADLKSLRPRNVIRVFLSWARWTLKARRRRRRQERREATRALAK